MRVQEVIKPTRPKTPEQQRLAALQWRADAAKQAVKAERERQRVQRARQQLAHAR